MLFIRRAYRLWCEALGYQPSCPLREPNYNNFIACLDKERLDKRFIETDDKKERSEIIQCWEAEISRS